MPATKKAVKKSFTIDCEAATEEEVIDLATFEKFLHDRIKVNGKTGQLQNVVEITRSETGITIETSAKFPKRYLKYLTKKFLKKNDMRDIFRVVAVNPSSYKLKWFAVAEDDEEDAE